MWIILNDWCGLACAIGTYLVVTSVYWGFIRIGIWEGIKTGDLKSLLHFIIFQYHCFLIFWSHFKTMTSEPGVIPRNVDVLIYQKLPKDLQKLIKAVGQRVK